ncbi:isoform 2 of tata element modulatory factor [Acrodontium crateriforme]|uniref:Isoform 2 of tata element modulatory factor n=1 Tax=Acrodontium crateriforme TaxID=150365 RepID=A0AAQ3M4C9_9PEZI|nr:isoform 2 of tata element modulatory factor [Acrodontium crateriforme]
MNTTMSSSKPPAKKVGGWGSLLSGAVANLESRLDTILAEDSDASARERAAAQAAKEAKARQQQELQMGGSTAASREASRSRANERLADRLAKATAHKQSISQTPSGVSSRVESPAMGAESVRGSMDSVRAQVEADRVEQSPKVTTNVGDEIAHTGSHVAEVGTTFIKTSTIPKDPTLLSSGLSISPELESLESSHLSTELSHEVGISPRTLSELRNEASHSSKSIPELEATVAQMEREHQQAERKRQDEMHVYMEKIDALQSKLKYLAKETVAAAKEANVSASSGSDAAKLAEKDERIALLMEEGERLSKIELRHSQTIKKLRLKITEDEKTATATKKKLERLERAEKDVNSKLRNTEAVEERIKETTRQIASFEKQVDELKLGWDTATERIRILTMQLSEAKAKADRAEQDVSSKISSLDRNKIANLENELEDAQIEKKLAEDRAAAESKKLHEEADRNKERSAATELELKNEIRSLEARLESMRSRAEEASSENSGDGGSVALLRQVETLQSQYSLAKENWQTIEGSLNARVSALEKERNEATKRETELRKKARDLGVRSRKVEEQLEMESERANSLAQDVTVKHEEISRLQARIRQAETGLDDARAEFDTKRKLWDIEMSQKLEEEKSRWQKTVLNAPGGVYQPSILSNGSLALSNRKSSAADLATIQTSRRFATRIASPDLSAPTGDPLIRPVSRRSSALPASASARASNSLDDLGSPSLSRRESTLSPFDTPSGMSMPPTPSIEVDRHSLSGSNSPQRTLNDLVSTSTAGAGPSVQLVERLSLAVRRLESEKASFKDELSRLSTQRDEARNEVVELMREFDSMRSNYATTNQMQNELMDVKRRYEASLQMLGEKEEETQDLKQDIAELKQLYRELVERKVGP